jgi:type I site-specific restriction endonuclease
MNEAETRAEHIDPTLKAAGWGVVDGNCILLRLPTSTCKTFTPQVRHLNKAKYLNFS